VSMAAEIAAESRRGRLLFPLKPIKHESFQGYVVRVAEWNAFRKPTSLLRALDLTPSPDLPWSRRALKRNGELVRRLGIPMEPAAKCSCSLAPRNA
jgi:hypothetical protein